MGIFSVVINRALKGDKLKLPSVELEYLLEKYQVNQGGVLPHPMTFEISSAKGPKKLKVFGTILEFTAEANHVEIGQFLARELGLNLDPLSDNDREANDDDGGVGRIYQKGVTLQVNPAALPKCSFALLEPLSSNYLEIPDIRSLLEAYLRSNFATIFQGATLDIDFGRNQLVKFKVAKLEPEPACICVDTDLEVDIQASGLNFTQQIISSAPHNNLQWIKSGVFYTLTTIVKSQPSVTYTIKVPKVNNQDIVNYQFNIDISKNDHDVNIFISDTNESPTLLDHLIFNVDKGSRSFSFKIDASKITEQPFLFIAIQSYNCNFSELSYSMKLVAGPEQEGPTQGQEIIPLLSNTDSQICKNCTLPVPSRTFQMHLAYCERNNTFCDKCKKVFKKSDFPDHWHCDQCDKFGHVSESEKHVSILHTLLKCSCGEQLYPAQVSQHKKEECVDRFIICRYCHLLLRAGPKSTTAKDLILGLGLTVHESSCGARTISCHKCGKAIQLKDISIHAKTHEMQKQKQPLPFQMCRNSICGNPQSSQFSNTLQLCQSCYRPFYSPRYDPTNQKVPQKIVETYHTQLTVGCGSDDCLNPVCCTSTDKSICPNGPLLPNDSAVIAIQMLQKSALMNPTTPQYSFCMSQDKVSANRHKMAQQLFEMSKGEEKMYKREWCIKALLESKEDVGDALRWLVSNAPFEKA